jgi:hypothetical protein
VCQTQTQETPLLSVEAFMRRVDAVSSTTMRRPDDKDHHQKKDQKRKIIQESTQVTLGISSAVIDSTLLTRTFAADETVLTARNCS